eukprot:203412_1
MSLHTATLRKANANYSQIPQSEQEYEHEHKGEDDSKELKHAAQKAASRISSLLHSSAWMCGAIFIWVYSKLWEVITTDVRVNRFWFSLGTGCLGFVLGAIGYMAFYLPFVSGVKTNDFFRYCPNVVKTTCFAMVVMWFSFVFALWTIYGFVSILIVSVTGMAAILSSNFIPSFFW